MSRKSELSKGTSHVGNVIEHMYDFLRTLVNIWSYVQYFYVISQWKYLWILLSEQRLMRGRRASKADLMFSCSLNNSFIYRMLNI